MTAQDAIDLSNVIYSVGLVVSFGLGCIWGGQR